MSLRVDSSEIIPAEIEGFSQDAFQNSLFIFKKPKWIADDRVGICNLCNNKFNQLRRKHHCRSCGGIFCNKCCLEKLPLPQFGLDGAERVCNRCLPMTSCVTMSHSMNPEFNLKAASGIAELCHQQASIVVKLGGAQMLIYLSTKINDKTPQILEYVASGIHNLAHQQTLVTWLASLGALNTIRNIIKNEKKITTIALCDALNALRIFVKTNDQLKITAIKTNCLPYLVELTSHTDASVSLIAISIICIIAESPRNHNTIINHHGIITTMIKQISTTSDEQVTEHVLKTLLTLSAGNEEVKHSLSSEDAACGGIISKVIKSKPKNQQIIAYAANIMANLATSERDQILLQDGMKWILSNLSNSSFPHYVQIQLIKAAANFSKFPAHSTIMLEKMKDIACLLSRDNSDINGHVVRLFFNLLKYQPHETINKLNSCGFIVDFLLAFTQMKNVVDETLKSIEVQAPSHTC